ncbi:hypothetical protein O1L60_10630 [Streptomyces diastatochromogenes]|nr:hypothetical protein [Streptomyces diastatochromogenes]
MSLKLYSPDDLAERFKVPVRTVYSWNHKGTGPGTSRSVGTSATGTRTSNPGSTPRRSPHENGPQQVRQHRRRGPRSATSSTTAERRRGPYTRCAAVERSFP